MQQALITGGTGFIGRNLIPLLQQKYQVTVLSRTPEKFQDDYFYKDIKLVDDLSKIESADLVINLAGENLANKRWNTVYKHVIKHSRIGGTIQLVDWMDKLEKKPDTFISGSAIGYYGGRDNEELTESSAAGNPQEFQVDLCLNWEASALRAAEYGIRTCIIRTGVVLGDQGALQKMLVPFKFGLGGKLGGGQQYFSWIHIQDHINAVMHILNNPKLSGAFNLTAPHPVTNLELTQALGKVLNRPTFASMPSFALKVIMGEMADMLLSGQRVMPQKLLNSGFRYQHPELKETLVDLLN